VVDRKVKVDQFQGGLVERFFASLLARGQALKIYKNDTKDGGAPRSPLLEGLPYRENGTDAGRHPPAAYPQSLLREPLASTYTALAGQRHFYVKPEQLEQPRHLHSRPNSLEESLRDGSYRPTHQYR